MDAVFGNGPLEGHVDADTACAWIATNLPALAREMAEAVGRETEAMGNDPPGSWDRQRENYPGADYAFLRRGPAPG